MKNKNRLIILGIAIVAVLAIGFVSIKYYDRKILKAPLKVVSNGVINVVVDKDQSLNEVIEKIDKEGKIKSKRVLKIILRKYKHHKR